MVYMRRSEVGGGEICFCEKHGPLRLLRTVLLPSQLLIKQWNWRKKTCKKKFFLKNFGFLKIPKNFFQNFFNFFLEKFKLVNHWLQCIKTWKFYSLNSSRYGRCKNCTKNIVFCPKITLGWWKVDATPKRHFCIAILTLCANMKLWLKIVYEFKLVQGNVPKTHFFAPNSEPPYAISTKPPKGTSTA